MNLNGNSKLLNYLIGFIGIFSFCFQQATAQTEVDSLKKLTLDSINKIKLEIIEFDAVNAFEIKTMDSISDYLLQENNLPGIKLNMPHPARFWNPTQAFGHRLWDHGLHGLRFDNQAIENYRFISPNKAISEIELQRGRSFTNSQASFQDNYDLHLIFASRFRNQVIWNFSYNRQQNKGIYAFGAQENTLFNTGIFYKNLKESFSSSLVFSDERHGSQDHWGIVNDSFLLDPNFRVRESVPVNNSKAKTLQFERSVLLNLQYRFTKSNKLFNPGIRYTGFYSLFSFNYRDNGKPLDSILYNYFYVDSFTIQNYLHAKLISQKINLELINHPNIQSSVEYQLDLNNMDHDSLNQQKVVTAISFINQLKFKSRSAINTKLSPIYFDDKIGLNASVSSELIQTKWLSGQLSAMHTQSPIPYSFSYLNLNKSYFWELANSSPFITEWAAQLKLTSKGFLNAGFDLKFSNYSNFVYFDSTAHPKTGSSIAKTALQLHLNFNARKWNTHNQFYLESYQPDPAHLNGWHSDHTISYNQHIFKKIVQSEFGLQFKLYQFDYKFNFNPILQSFYSSNLSNDFLYTMGLYMHFNISDFKLSLYADQLDSFWNEKRPSLVKNYPLYDFYFRFGITWKFQN